MTGMERRVNIGERARAYRAGNLPPFQDMAFAISPDSKPELYALGAVLIDRVVGRAYDSRDVEAMASVLVGKQPFLDLKPHMIEALEAEAESLDRRIEEGSESSSIQAVAERLRTLYALGYPRERGDMTPSRYINAGIKTAASFMANTLDLITVLGGKPVDQKRLLEIAENTYPLVVGQASAHLLEFGAFQAGTRLRRHYESGGPFYHEFFQITRTAEGRERVELSPKGVRSIADFSAEPKDEGTRSLAQKPTVGCPAIVNFDGQSAVKKLWRWNLEVAEKVWARDEAQPVKTGFVRRVLAPYFS